MIKCQFLNYSKIALSIMVSDSNKCPITAAYFTAWFIAVLNITARSIAAF